MLVVELSDSRFYLRTAEVEDSKSISELEKASNKESSRVISDSEKQGFW